MREIRKSHKGPGGLIKFVRTFWSVLEPNIPLVEGWCLDGMCQHLEGVHFGEITRLLINISPGSMKSLLVNVFFQRGNGDRCGVPICATCRSPIRHI